MNADRTTSFSGVCFLTFCLISTACHLQAADVPSGPEPVPPTDPEALLPGPYPNDSVTGVNYHLDASQVTLHDSMEKDDIIFTLEGQGPIPWTLTSYGRGLVSPRIGAIDEKTSSSNLGVIPFDITFDGRRYEWQNDLLFWAPSAAAWRPHPSKGVLLGSIRRNGQQWSDQAPLFYGLVSVPLNSSEGEGYSMVDGRFGTGDMDVVIDKVGPASFAPIDFGLAWFPFDQGWKGGFIASPNPDLQDGAWLGDGYHSQDLPVDAGEMVQWTRAFATWAVPGKFRLPGVNARTDGMLFTTSVESRFSAGMMIAVAINDEGDAWEVWGRNNVEADPLFQEESSMAFSFVYIPYDSDRLVGGHIRGTDGAVINGRGNFAMKRLSTGRYELRIPEKTGKDGMVLLQATGRHRMNGRETVAASRTFFSYEEVQAGTFEIQSRYFENESSFPLEDSEFYFAWVDFLTPLAPAGSTPLPDPPILTMQPIGQEVKRGDSVTFQVKAEGEGPLAYQWERDGVDLAEATGASYTITDAQTSHAGVYRVLVSNHGGAVTSSAAILTVHTPPVILQQPSNQTIPVGQPLMLSIQVQATGQIMFQWQFNQQDIAGQVTDSMTIPAAQLVHAGQYRVLITSPGGSILSESAVVTVNASTLSQSPQIIQQPQSQTLAAGRELRLEVQAKGTAPLTYRWQYQDINIPGAATPVFVIADAQSGDSGLYRVIVTNDAGSVISAPAVVNVTTSPVILSQPQSVAAVSGDLVRFRVEATGLAPLNYQWQINGFNIPGARGVQFLIEQVQTADAGTYGVVITDGTGAKTISNPAVLSVSDQTLPAFSMTSISFSGGGILLEWDGAPGIVLQAKATLGDAQWRDVPGTDGQGKSLQALIGVSAFYRLIKR
jgi:hypothetical protein